MFHLYADDVQIYLSRPFNLLEDLSYRMNEDLQRIYEWAICNGLTLNPAKSQIIAISRQKFDTIDLPPIILSQHKLEFASTVTSLGFKINCSLSANDHINLAVGRYQCALRKLNMFAGLMPVDVKLRISKSLLVPIIEYASVVYAKLDSLALHKLLVAFNSIIRFIFGLQRFDHVSQYHQLVLGSSFQHFLDARCCIFLHKIINKKTPSYLYDKLNFAQSARTLNIITPLCTYLNSSRLFYVYATRLWNSLPLPLKQVIGILEFKKTLINHLNSSQHTNSRKNILNLFFLI